MSKKNRKLILFATLYIFAIPIFALIFNYYSNEFYHSTIKFEENQKDEQKDILRSLELSMIETYKTVNHTEDLDDIYYFTIKDIKFYNLEYENGYYTFDLISDYKGDEKDLPPNPLNLKFCLSWETEISPSLKEYGIECSNYKDMEQTLKMLFPSRFEQFRKNQTIGYITVSNSLQTKLKNFRDTILGRPIRSENNYWRMFYLSSVTITTVGYGDIIPTSTLTRILVSVEAILGVVLIGLFINASFLKE